MASTIKVDNVQNQPGTNIINKCGTTITLGASSDTIALAAGASQTGFGRTGTVDWITTPKVTGDSPITGVTGKGYFMNTTAGAITINLPAGAAGSIISMADYAGTWQTNNVTVSPNGAEKIGGVAAAATLNTEGQSVTFVYVDGTQGWVNTMDSTSNVRGETFVTATVSGACNTLATAPCCANTKIATFLGPGTFCVSATSGCAGNNVVSYMLVAGGGGGGGDLSGGGGAGGYREVKSPVTPYTASPLEGYPNEPNRVTVSATPYPIGVGGGGARGTTPASTVEGCRGNPSTFSTITSTGGGAGMVRTSSETGPPAPAKSPGGSGGGASYNNGTNGTGNTPPVSPAQGTNGGTAPGSADAGGGGGGGATVAGGPAAGPTTPQGAGGAGTTTSISATPTAYAGGGGGGAWSVPTSAGAGGAGGGGAGGNALVPGAFPGTAGTVNTGGGGGGANAVGPAVGGAGGSGVVIIRYKFQ